MLKWFRIRGGFRGRGGGGGWGAEAFSFRDSTPCRPKGSPLWYFLGNPLSRNPQYLLLLRGVRAPKKRNFLVKIFQKVPKNAFFDCFFLQKFACGAENFAKVGAKQCFGRAQKINLVDLKKRPSKFSISF